MSTFYNDAGNYMNAAKSVGFWSSVPEKTVFNANDEDEICKLHQGFDPTPEEQVFEMLDDIDMAIIDEVARSKYLIRVQIYQYLMLRGCTIVKEKILRKLNKLVKHHLLCAYEIRYRGSEDGLRYYALDFRGFKLAVNHGVPFHMGNRFLPDRKKEEQGIIENPSDIKRVLAANMVILNLLRNKAAIDRFGIMETERPNQPGNIGRAIMRSTAKAYLGDDLLLFEVVRSAPDSMSKIADKIQRYYALIHDEAYLEDHPNPPQLIICAENQKHAQMIQTYLEDRHLINEDDTILYTYDLLHLGSSLAVFYELKGAEQIWYGLPSVKGQDHQERYSA